MRAFAQGLRPSEDLRLQRLLLSVRGSDVPTGPGGEEEPHASDRAHGEPPPVRRARRRTPVRTPTLLLFALLCTQASLVAPSFTASASASSPLALDAVHRHPRGFHFAHPSGWALREAMPDVLALTPADVARHGGQPAEVLLVFGEDAGGLVDPTDPRVITSAEQGVAQLLPFLERRGETETVELGGRATARLQWAGTSPTGLEAEATMWITMLEGAALVVFGAGPVERIAARRPTLEAMTASIGYEAPAGDPRLLGHWRHTDTQMSGDFSMVDERHLYLRADGSFLQTGTVMAGMQHGDGSGGYAGDSHASNTGLRSSGRWHTVDKTITLEWADGRVETWDYLITATDLMFRRGERKKLWERIE